MWSLRARRISVSRISSDVEASARPRVRLLVSVPGHRVQEAYDILAAIA
jgi:hypothetical protein